MAEQAAPVERPLRVLLAAHNLDAEARAGTESYCLNLGKALEDLGAGVTFLAPQGAPIQGPRDEVSWRRGELAGLPFLFFSRMNQDLCASLSIQDTTRPFATS